MYLRAIVSRNELRKEAGSSINVGAVFSPNMDDVSIEFKILLLRRGKNIHNSVCFYKNRILERKALVRGP